VQNYENIITHYNAIKTQTKLASASLLHTRPDLSLVVQSWHTTSTTLKLSVTCFNVELQHFLHGFASRGFVSDSWAFLLPARRYPSASLCDRNVSVCTSVRHTPVSPSGSPTILLFWCQIVSKNFKEPPSGDLKQGWDWTIQPFSSFKRKYLENGSRYGQSYY